MVPDPAEVAATGQIDQSMRRHFTSTAAEETAACASANRSLHARTSGSSSISSQHDSTNAIAAARENGRRR
jgi:hypothetical protein